MNPPSDPSPSSRSWPFARPVRPRCTLATRNTPADCPSGQWERTVNPSANAYPGSNPGSATCVVPQREVFAAGLFVSPAPQNDRLVGVDRDPVLDQCAAV